MFLEVMKHLDVLIALLAVVVDHRQTTPLFSDTDIVVRFKQVKKPHSFTYKQNGTCQVLLMLLMLLMLVCASLNGRQL